MSNSLKCSVCGYTRGSDKQIMEVTGDLIDGLCWRCPNPSCLSWNSPPPPVDRSQQQLTDGSPVPEDRSHTELLPDGQQKGYVVLSPEERAKGFVRPVRRSYRHLKCGTVTTMGQALAETYARDPKFYSGTFCCHCAAHYPLSEFVWSGTTETVGS